MWVVWWLVASAKAQVLVVDSFVGEAARGSLLAQMSTSSEECVVDGELAGAIRGYLGGATETSSTEVVPCRRAFGSVAAHIDHFTSGEEAEISVVAYLTDAPDSSLVLADRETSEEFEVEIRAGRLVSWENHRFVHSVKGSGERAMLGPVAMSPKTRALLKVGVPSPLPTPVPTSLPSASPPNPTSSPSLLPTPMPTSLPVIEPTATPSEVPIAAPTEVPIAAPSLVPSLLPIAAPTLIPTNSPVKTTFQQIRLLASFSYRSSLLEQRPSAILFFSSFQRQPAVYALVLFRIFVRNGILRNTNLLSAITTITLSNNQFSVRRRFLYTARRRLDETPFDEGALQRWLEEDGTSFNVTNTTNYTVDCSVSLTTETNETTTATGENATTVLEASTYPQEIEANGNGTLHTDFVGNATFTDYNVSVASDDVTDAPTPADVCTSDDDCDYGEICSFYRRRLLFGSYFPVQGTCVPE